jgi:hypothetical protein
VVLKIENLAVEFSRIAIGQEDLTTTRSLPLSSAPLPQTFLRRMCLIQKDGVALLVPDSSAKFDKSDFWSMWSL